MRAGQIIAIGQSRDLTAMTTLLRDAGEPASVVPTLGLARVNHGAIVLMDDTIADPVDNAKMVLDSGGHLIGLGPLAPMDGAFADLKVDAAEQGVLLEEGLYVTGDPALELVQMWIQDDLIGDIEAIHCEEYGSGPGTPRSPANWRHVGISAILLGQAPIRIEVAAYAPDKNGVSTYSVCQILTQDGVSAVLNRSTIHPIQQDRVVIVGTQATCVWSVDKDGCSEVVLFPLHQTAEREHRFDREMHLRKMSDNVRALVADSSGSFAHLQGGLSGLLELIALAAKNKEAISMSNEPSNYFVHPTAIVDGPVEIGSDTKIWHFSKLLGPLTIGQSCSLGQNVVVERHVAIGNNVKIQNNVSVYSGVILEDDVFCGPSMVFTNVGTPRSAYPRKGQYLETRVRTGASIGANATIVCGHTLGEYCFVGAGSVVTKDVPAYALVYGNPARIRGWACFCGERLELGLQADETETTNCQECGRNYRRDGHVIEQVK